MIQFVLKDVSHEIFKCFCFYSKKNFSLFLIATNFLDLLQMYKLRHTITNYNGQNFGSIHSFVSVNDGNTILYYAMNHYGSNILVYNEYWEYQKNVSVTL